MLIDGDGGIRCTHPYAHVGYTRSAIAPERYPARSQVAVGPTGVFDRAQDGRRAGATQELGADSPVVPLDEGAAPPHPHPVKKSAFSVPGLCCNIKP